MKRMRVCVVTGTRAEFGIWQAPLRAMRKSARLDVRLVVTGMHLLKEFGSTVRDVERSGIPIAARVAMYRKGEPAAKGLARGIGGLAAAYRKIRADLVLVLGDRLEMLAAASAALAERIAIGHVHGGESAMGIWDEQIRHAITKMAQVHFCATKLAGERILQMGEAPETVHVVGAPALDGAAVLANHAGLRAAIDRIYHGKSHLRRPILLLHPSSTDEGRERERALMAVGALRCVYPEYPLPVIGPNNDPGHGGILEAYGRRAEDLSYLPSVPQEQFWTMLLFGGVLVGNSSSGIIEAATFGIPVVNIGERQSGRERNGNVVDVPWEAGAREIEKAIRFAISEKAFLKKVATRENLYGDGRASERVVKVLEGIARNGVGLEKRFVTG
jgi:UDP-hydrolysing UDP-N-acetyl-D-glucosamine 2-epimerase